MSFKLELFHQIADRGSAHARQFITRRGLESGIRFRNMVYPEVEKAWVERGGMSLPALWDGKQLHQGEAAVMARLQALVNNGSSSV